ERAQAGEHVSLRDLRVVVEPHRDAIDAVEPAEVMAHAVHTRACELAHERDDRLSLVAGDEKFRAREREPARRIRDGRGRRVRRGEPGRGIQHRPRVRVRRLRYVESDSGSTRSRLPVAAASALATAGAIGGTPGSPTPVGLSVDGTMCTSMAGISLIRNTR